MAKVLIFIEHAHGKLPKTSLVENSSIRSTVSFVARAASSA